MKTDPIHARNGRTPRALAHARGRLAAGLAVALVVACSPPAATEHAAHGKLVEIDAAKHTVTLDHGEIPGLMQGMTMTFDVAPEVELGSLAEGADVDFRVRAKGSAITVIELRPTAQP